MERAVGWFVILAVATLAGMALFTWLALVGFHKFRLKRFERYEAGLLAAVATIMTLAYGLLLFRGPFPRDPGAQGAS